MATVSWDTPDFKTHPIISPPRDRLRRFLVDGKLSITLDDVKESNAGQDLMGMLEKYRRGEGSSATMTRSTETIHVQVTFIGERVRQTKRMTKDREHPYDVRR